MTHSPLPWRQDGHTIVDANGTEVVDYVHESADRPFIVTAVNAHAALVAALEACRNHIIGTTGARVGSDSEEMVQEANAALELARKGGA